MRIKKTYIGHPAVPRHRRCQVEWWWWQEVSLGMGKGFGGVDEAIKMVTVSKNKKWRIETYIGCHDIVLLFGRGKLQRQEVGLGMGRSRWWMKL